MTKEIAKFILDIAEAEKEYFDRILDREDPVKVKSDILKMLKEKGRDYHEIIEFGKNICNVVEKANYIINKATERYKGVGQGYRADLGRESYSGKEGTPRILKESSFLRAIFPKGVDINDQEKFHIYPQKIKLYPFAIGFFISPHTKEEIKLFEGKNGFAYSMPEYLKILYNKQRKEINKKVNLFMERKGSFPHEESTEYSKSDLERCLSGIDGNLNSGVKSPHLRGLQPFTFFVRDLTPNDQLKNAIFGRNLWDQSRVDETENHELKHVIDKFLSHGPFMISDDLYDISGNPFDCAELSARLYAGQNLTNFDINDYEERIQRIKGFFSSNLNKEEILFFERKIIFLENRINDLKEAYDRANDIKNRFDPKVLSYIVGFSRAAKNINKNFELLKEA